MIIRINVDIFDSDEEIVKNEVMKFIRRLSYSGREIDYNFEISTINGTKKSENIYKKKRKVQAKKSTKFLMSKISQNHWYIRVSRELVSYV